MQEFESGVSWYAKGEIRMMEYFPQGLANCRHCRFCKYNKDFSVYRCFLTDESIDKAALNNRGEQCPIIFEETIF